MTSTDDRKSELLARAAELARKSRGGGGPAAADVEALIAAYFRHIADEDVVERSEVDVYGALTSHYKFAASRPQGTATIRVFNPSIASTGWSAAGHTVVEIVTDDMPFLVDSMTMTLNELDHNVHVALHPLFEVRRDLAGELRDIEISGVDLAESADNAAEGHIDESGLETIRESWMHLEIDRVSDPAELTAIEEALHKVLRDVRDAVEDWPRMRAKALEIVTEFEKNPPSKIDADEFAHGLDFLRWLADDHFAFLGFREYELRAEGDELALAAVPGTGFGILRGDQVRSKSFQSLPPPQRERAREQHLLVLAKANSKATVHRNAYLDYVGVKKFDEAGDVIGERRFLGLFSAAAYTESVLRIPLLREKAQRLLDNVGIDDSSHTGKQLLNVLENYPRDELFLTPSDEILPIAESVMLTRERRQLRLFIRRDTYRRYVSCLVYLPRDRYNTAVREKMARTLRDELGGESVDFSVRLGESSMAQVHFVVRPEKGELIKDFRQPELERKLIDITRSWRDGLASAINADFGEEVGARLSRKYVNAFPEAYKEDFASGIGAADVARLEDLRPDANGDAIDLMLLEKIDSGRGEARLKIFRIGSPLSLSAVLPMISSLGVDVVDERPYGLMLDQPTYIYEFGLRYPGDALSLDDRERFQDCLRAIWDGRNEIDGFNTLILKAGLTWRQVAALRACAKYMRQGSSPFAYDSIVDALVSNVDIVRLLVELFRARFDPEAFNGGADDERRTTAIADLHERIGAALEDVASLDHDRILRSYLAHIEGTLRTNYYQPDADGQPKTYISFKLDPSEIPDLPAPRPKFEIFVYSPRVEGVHLRFGSVARGGLRWSDRRDDFRTEVLGLVKAQMVKNTVIVPVGAKGGFYCKQLPDSSDREAWLAEGIACYRTFISGLLDVTDNLVEGETVPPRDVVRHDGDDAYLVVAADKGTASFSDIANGVSQDYGFWLGDAFASGGSVGYDHKAMGITARGAWVSVQRHFRERGIDCQTEDFTAVGIGDMSGDVFGNGMLCSEHTRLVAAFDHRDIFLDPQPDAAASYAERKRLFELPRSSWQDYDTSLISSGGGVFSRAAKSIPLNDAIREALGIDEGVDKLTPAELMRAILVAPVDLLWNGGIGTYVKSSDESNADAGDKANDPIRVNGEDLRAECVGEGGNLGFTQLGRIEYARRGCGGEGGRINTDFIDNSAGVDTSDHEVNIKILLDRVVAAGDLTQKQRNKLLAEMTDEVAELVLRDNYEQNLALANAAAHGAPLLHVHESWMKKLEADHVIDRELEGLPSSREVRRRLDRGQGLSVPELSVLMAWTKIVLADELLASDLPDDPFLHTDLFVYFPTKMRHGYREQMLDHPLKREIIVTQVVNDLVNGAGLTFWPRLAGETGATAAELTNANFVAREIFGSLALRDELKTYDNSIDAELQTQMRIEMRTLVERASRWLITNRRAPLDSEATSEFFSVPVQRLMADLPEIITGGELAAFEARRDGLVSAGVPEELATKVAVLHPAYHLLGIVEIADRLGGDALEIAKLHFALGERLGLPALVSRILALPRDDRWQTMARSSLRDDLYAVHASLTGEILQSTQSGSAADRVAEWEAGDEVLIQRATSTLTDITKEEGGDLARLSVALRVVRGLVGA